MLTIKKLEKPRTKLSLEEQIKAYKPKKVKALPIKSILKNQIFGKDLTGTLKVEDESIQELLNECHSDIKTLVDGKISTYIAKPNLLILILKNKMRVKIEYGQQYKNLDGSYKSPKRNIIYTLTDSHNKIIA
jgi:hypothetical protein